MAVDLDDKDALVVNLHRMDMIFFATDARMMSEPGFGGILRIIRKERNCVINEYSLPLYNS
ncbi:MAG: hypothetical protein ABIR18_06355 [Chitinophagaceae bacterium]